MTMRTRPIGKTDIKASVVAYGAWAIGGWMWGGADEAEAIKSIHAAAEMGINFIDTAPIYGFGVSENIIGKAIAGRRDQFVIADKCGMVTHGRGGELFFRSSTLGRDENGLIEVYKNLRPESIRTELELSLRRLGTDYIDLYQTHWQETTTPIAESMQTLLDLKKEGKIRAIGVSNASVSHMQEYLDVGQLDSDQEKYSMLDRQPERETLPFCQQNNLSFLAYSPLSMGLLTGKMTADRKFNTGDIRLLNERYSVQSRTKINNFLTKLSVYTESYRCSLTQLVIAWTIDRPGVTHALCGARSAEQIIDNARGGMIELSKEDHHAITKLLNASLA